MHIARIGFLITTAWLMIAGSTFGQGGPPMITDDTGTVDQGHFEINTAFTMEFGEDGRVWGTPLIDFNYGTSRHTQLKIEIPSYVLNTNGQPGVHAFGN